LAKASLVDTCEAYNLADAAATGAILREAVVANLAAANGVDVKRLNMVE
jgi:hypothetical protein